MPSELVLDASAAVDLILRRPGRGEWVRARLAGGEAIHAPHLLDVEVASALRRNVLTGAVTTERARQSLDLFVGLEVERYAAELLLDRVWALRDALSAYDAMYVSLAEILGAPLVTTDDRLARATGHRAAVVGFPG